MGVRFKVLSGAFLFIFLAMPAWAQVSSVDDAVTGYESATHQSFQGIPTDWSSNHVVFSKPAAGSDAEDKVQQDPRYWLQQIRRSQAASAEISTDNGADADADEASTFGWSNGSNTTNPKKNKKNKKSSLTGLWSVNLGSGATVGNEMDPATFTAGTSASCTNDFVVYNTSLAGAAPVAATGTGTFATPATSAAGTTVTINGVTLTATGVGTDTIINEPGSGATTVIDGVTYTWTTTTCTAFTPTATSGCVVRVNSTTTDATNLEEAITNSCSSTSACKVSSANPGATAVTNAANVVIVTNTSASAITWSESSNQTLSPTGSISAASTSGTDFALSTNTTTAAANLTMAINNNPSTDVTATSTGAVVTVTATTAGTAGNSITTAETLAAFSWGGTTLAGGTAGTASIVGFNNIYDGTCTGTVPTVNWAFNTGGAVVTSPVISASGDQVAFVQSVSGAASLVLLKWSAGSGTLSAPTALTSNSSYPSCTAPCMISLPFSGGANDTNSAPFAILFGPTAGTLFVGDNAGKLHKFSNIFTGGTPLEATSPWPVTVNAGTAMSSPVADANTNLVFLGDAGGSIHSVSFTGIVTTAALGGVITDGPLLDVSLPKVYWFATLPGTNANPLTDYVEQTSEALGAKEEVIITNGGNNGAYTGAMHVGEFDNTYYNTPATGFLYVCAVDNSGAFFNIPALYRIGFGAGGVMNTTLNRGPLDFAASPSQPANECSPITEIQTATTDDFFASVQKEGDLNHCTGSTTVGCLYSFAISAQTFPGNSTAGLTSEGGTSGISIDNLFSTAGASQVYFTPLANQTCTTGGTGGCATQASQAGLN